MHGIQTTVRYNNYNLEVAIEKLISMFWRFSFYMLGSENLEGNQGI